MWLGLYQFFNAIWLTLHMCPCVFITIYWKIMKVTVRNYFMESMDEPIWMVIFAKLIVIGDKIIKITKYAPSTNR